MENTLNGKTYVITGATSGIGLATAQALVAHGADVIGIGRSPERCRSTEQQLKELNPHVKVTYCVADLAIQSQVRALRSQVGAILQSWEKEWLDGLVNNAGTFTYWFSLTPEGFETQWAVNHLAPFLLTHELLSFLMAAPMARVVTVSSASHYSGRLNWEDLQLRRRYNGLRAYENTKLANVLFTQEFNRQMGAQATVKAFAADPGLVKTEMGFKGTPAVVRWFWGLRREGGTDPQVPARGIVYLLSEPGIQNSPHPYWKDGQPKQPSRQALDGRAATQLWQISEAMCGIGKGD